MASEYSASAGMQGKTGGVVILLVIAAMFVAAMLYSNWKEKRDKNKTS